MSSLRPQPTGQSTATLDAAYEGVFSQLDALAAQPPNLSFSYPTPPSTSSNPSRPSRNIPSSDSPRSSSSELGFVPMESVSERTEPPSTSNSRSSSPRDDAARSESSILSATSIAQRFPLPPSPVKGPRSAQTQTSPSKASDLIKMFESRASDPIPQPSFAPAATSRTVAKARQPSPNPEPVEPLQQASLAAGTGPSYYEELPVSMFQRPRPTSQSLFESPRTPPLKPHTPLSQVRTMIASWRARAGSPRQRVIGSPGKGGDAPRLFGRDRGWNVSIRRRRRNEGNDDDKLAEQADEPFYPATRSFGSEAASGDGGQGSASEFGKTSQLQSRSPSCHSSLAPSIRSEGPRQLTGQVSFKSR